MPIPINRFGRFNLFFFLDVSINDLHNFVYISKCSSISYTDCDYVVVPLRTYITNMINNRIWRQHQKPIENAHYTMRICKRDSICVRLYVYLECVKCMWYSVQFRQNPKMRLCWTLEKKSFSHIQNYIMAHYIQSNFFHKFHWKQPPNDSEITAKAKYNGNESIRN